MKKRGCELFLIVISLIFMIGFISAVDYCIQPTLTEISPSSVGIDEEFTVGILLDNCGDIASKTISFELRDISPEIYVKEPLISKINNIGYAADRFLIYHMKTSKNITPGDYYLDYKLDYSGTGDNTYVKEGTFMITIIGDKAELSIASVKLKPVLPKEKETVELTLRLENFGDGKANSIKLELNHSFSGTKESFIGTLNSDEDGPAVFTFIAPKEGEYKIPVKITYQDDFGPQEINTEIKVQIVGGDGKWGYILLGCFIIGIIAWLIFYAVKVKKAKEKVIHQLIKGSASEKKKNLKSK